MPGTTPVLSQLTSVRWQEAQERPLFMRARLQVWHSYVPATSPRSLQWTSLRPQPTHLRSLVRALCTRRSSLVRQALWRVKPWCRTACEDRQTEWHSSHVRATSNEGERLDVAGTRVPKEGWAEELDGVQVVPRLVAFEGAVGRSSPFTSIAALANMSTRRRCLRMRASEALPGLQAPLLLSKG